MQLSLHLERIGQNAHHFPLVSRTFGPDLTTPPSVKRRKLGWYGHVTRSSGLAKTVLQGTVAYKEINEETDRENTGKVPSENGLVLNGTSYSGKMRIARSRGSWL